MQTGLTPKRSRRPLGFGCHHMGDYHDLYNRTDVLLLVDVFKAFQNTCMGEYGLAPIHYFSSPGLLWDAFLKSTGVELELLTDYDQHLFIEKGINGGIAMVSRRFARANNPRVERFDLGKPTHGSSTSTTVTYTDGRQVSLYPEADSSGSRVATSLPRP